MNEYKNKSGLKLLLFVREAVQALAVSERTLWEMPQDGVIASIKVGTRLARYPVAELER